MAASDVSEVLLQLLDVSEDLLQLLDLSLLSKTREPRNYFKKLCLVNHMGVTVSLLKSGHKYL